MSQIIKNGKDLDKLIQSRLSLALKFTQQEIYKVIQENIKNYYEEKVFLDRVSKKMSAIPNAYFRTYQFLNSLIKTDIIVKNGTVSCSVRIDTESLDYIQDGDIVVDMINRGYHADTSLNDDLLSFNDRGYRTPYDIYAKSHFWDDSLEQLGGYNGILEIMKKNCRKVGLNIK